MSSPTWTSFLYINAHVDCVYMPWGDLELSVGTDSHDPRIQTVGGTSRIDQRRDQDRRVFEAPHTNVAYES
ncbi:hypothetical protein GCM10009536_65340 [Streptomyces thermocarboxydus]